MLQSNLKTHGYHSRPNRYVYNNRKKFIGWKFLFLLAKMGIKDICTAVWNPQSNEICKRIHQTIGYLLWVVLHNNPPMNMDDANQVIDNVLTTCMHTTRCCVSSLIRISPGALVYGRNMIMDVQLIANLAAIRDSWQYTIDENLIKQNKERIERHFCLGDRAVSKIWWTVLCFSNSLQWHLDYTTNTNCYQYAIHTMVCALQRIVMTIILYDLKDQF